MVISNKLKEILFPLIVYAVIFFIYAYDQHDDSFLPYQFAFFANYAVVALIITFFLIPRYLLSRKWGELCLGVFALISMAVVIEESLLERFFFDGTRAEIFNYFSTIMDIIPIVFMLVGVLFGRDLLQKQNRVEILEREARESELKYLKSQINPHFLFNNLNNLYSYALEGSGKTAELILELSDVLRYIIYDGQKKLVPLEQDLNHLKQFTQLSTLQIENRGEVHFNVSGEFKGQMIAPMILLFFVENAFKHSQSGLSDGIVIHIETTIDDQKLTFNCTNNYHPSTNLSSPGIGLKNVIRRLNLLYPDNELIIEDRNQSYQVELKLNLEIHVDV